MDDYIKILIRSLEKKLAVLERITEENKRQEQILKQEDLDLDAFRESTDRKAECIDELNFLDEGFEKTYQRVKTTLESNRQDYAEEIQELQRLIAKITDESVNVQKAEQQNRRLAELQFGNEHKKMRQVKASNKAASHYYKSMSNLNYVEPQFMDKKK